MSLTWKKQTLKNKWESIFSHLKQEIQKAEITSIVENHRKASWQSVKEKGFFEFHQKWTKRGLLLRPVRRSGNFKGFSHYHPNAKRDGSDLLQVVLSKDKKYLDSFETAFFSGDQKTQGELLGFPSCCISFFEKVWKEKNYDPVFEAYKNTDLKKEVSPLSNPLLRYIGLRIGFHIPCSFNCQKTIALGEKRLTLLNQFDAKILLSILSLPLTGSRRNGILCIDSKYFKIITGSNIRPGLETLTYLGTMDIFKDA